MHRPLPFVFVALLTLAVALPPQARAQQQTGVVEGRVTDAEPFLKRHGSVTGTRSLFPRAVSLL